MDSYCNFSIKHICSTTTTLLQSPAVGSTISKKQQKLSLATTDRRKGFRRKTIFPPALWRTACAAVEGANKRWCAPPLRVFHRLLKARAVFRWFFIPAKSIWLIITGRKRNGILSQHRGWAELGGGVDFNQRFVAFLLGTLLMFMISGVFG